MDQRSSVVPFPVLSTGISLCPCENLFDRCSFGIGIVLHVLLAPACQFSSFR